VYDLSLYPAATKTAGDEDFAPLETSADLDVASAVFVMYEYGELDNDEVFDANAITWCQVFVQDKSSELRCVFDDETA
jgi:hypothetical protein